MNETCPSSLLQKPENLSSPSPSPQKKSIVGTLGAIIKVVTSLGIIGYLVHSFRLDVRTIHLVHPAYLMVVMIAFLVQPLVMAIRWRLLLTCFNQVLSYIRLSSIIFISIFFNQFLPASVGGDAVRIWYGRREGISLENIAGSILIDRISALLGLFFMIAVFLPLAHRVIVDQNVIWVLAVLVAAGIFGTGFLLLLRPLTHLAGENRFLTLLVFPTNALYVVLRQGKETLISVLGLSFLVHIISAIGLYGIVLAFGNKMDILSALILLPPIILAQMIPISIGGWGIREMAAVTALSSMGLDPAQALVISLVFGALLAAASLPGALLWILYRSQTALVQQ